MISPMARGFTLIEVIVAMAVIGLGQNSIVAA